MHTNTTDDIYTTYEKKLSEIRFNLAHGRWLCKVEFCDSTGKDEGRSLSYSPSASSRLQTLKSSTERPTTHTVPYVTDAAAVSLA